MSNDNPQDPNRPFVMGQPDMVNAWQQQPPRPDLPYPGGHDQPPKKPMSKEARIGWMILAGLGIFVSGILIGSPTTAAPANVTAGQPTVTVPGPAGETVTLPPVTKTVTRPGPTVKVTVTAPPPGPASVMTEDGIYLVGTDIKPGRYKSGPNGDCYWARLSGTSGDFDDILANHNGGNSVVTIRKTDVAFETARCGEWRKVG